MKKIKSQLLEYYEKNETKADIAFFLGGVLLDIFTLSDIDDPISILQQVLYLASVGSILYFDFLGHCGVWAVPPRLEKIWNYRQLIVHFLMGSLLSMYSLFFLKSSSFFSSIFFVLFLVALMVANEMKAVQKSEVNLKVGLYVICLFSFFSMMYPVLLGFVGWLPFILSAATTAVVLFGVFKLIERKITDRKMIVRALVAPGLSVISLFVVFYLLGWIPPVPLSVQSMGVYHRVEKRLDKYELYFEKPWWKFWQTGDQDFLAEPEDKIFFFARIFSPARFDDSVILHWMFYDLKRGWQTTDKIAMRVTGGRKGGYRGFTTKQNFLEGDWRISVETTDGREIGRYYFSVTKAPQTNPERAFSVNTY